MYQKSTNKKIRSGNTILSLSHGVNNSDNLHVFIIYHFLLILNIRTIINRYIHIDKFITKLVVNVFKNESKLLAISLLSVSLKH